MVTRRSVCLFVGATALAPAAAVSQALAPALADVRALPAPKSKPIVTITGKIKNFNAPNSAVFDREGLEAIWLASFETMTPWYKAPVKFEGVPIGKLLSLVGAEGDKLIATALNDYTTEIPMADFAAYNVILALKRDGNYMPVADKGPLFIVYDFDRHPEIKSQKFYGRSAWQVARLEVR